MGKENSKKLSFITLLLLLAACGKDNNTPSPPKDASGEKVYVVCEGAYGSGNSALSLYLSTLDTSYNDYYYQVNQQKMGDVFQSMTRIGDQYFMAVNNSDKILVTDTNSKYLARINIRQPRYILPVSSTLAYVSTLYSNKVYIINPQSYSITDSVILPYLNPENMLLKNGSVYIPCWDTAGNKVYTVNATSKTITDSFTIAGVAPQDITEDKDGNLWILSGNVNRNKAAFLTKVTAAGQIIASYPFPDKADPLRLITNPAKDSLYFIEVNYNSSTDHNGIYRMSIYDQALPSTAFIPAQSFQYFWGLAIHPETGYIYVADPKGFVQRGQVSIYNQQGILQKQFATGVGPGHFYFAR